MTWLAYGNQTADAFRLRLLRQDDGSDLFPQCNTTASLIPGATTSCFMATETAYSKGTQIDYRFGFCSCGFSASPVETITQPFLPYYRAPHNHFTMLSHTSTFHDRPKTADWHFRFAFHHYRATSQQHYRSSILYSRFPVLNGTHVLWNSTTSLQINIV